MDKTIICALIAAGATLGAVYLQNQSAQTAPAPVAPAPATTETTPFGNGVGAEARPAAETSPPAASLTVAPSVAPGAPPQVVVVRTESAPAPPPAQPAVSSTTTRSDPSPPAGPSAGSAEPPLNLTGDWVIEGTDLLSRFKQTGQFFSWTNESTPGLIKSAQGRLDGRNVRWRFAVTIIGGNTGPQGECEGQVIRAERIEVECQHPITKRTSEVLVRVDG